MEEWVTEMYPSGTHVVKNIRDTKMPWFYVYADERYKVCKQIEVFMNGGMRPAWLDDVKKTSIESFDGSNNIKVRATGPMYDMNPPQLNWQEMHEDIALRKSLINRLLSA